MKNLLILNEDDIKRKIATSYGVSSKDIEIKHLSRTVGQGMQSYPEPYVEVVVTLSTSDNR